MLIIKSMACIAVTRKMLFLVVAAAILNLVIGKEVTCEEPVAPVHGSLRLLGNRKVDSLVLYLCDDGWMLVGASAAKCHETGQWTSPPPRCIEKGSSTVSTTTAVVPTKASVPPSTPEPKERPGVIETPDISLTPEITEKEECSCIYNSRNRALSATVNGLVLQYGGKVKKGDKMTISCSDQAKHLVLPNDTNISGTLNLTCDACQIWTDGVLPSCRDVISEITCREIDETDMLKISYTDNLSVGSIANFHCFAPGILSGMARTQCLSTGMWSHSPPTCKNICLLPMVIGTCDDKIPSWYFDSSSKTCKTFTYGGCLGNSNRFASKADCEAKCISQQTSIPVTTAPETSKTANEANSSSCKLSCIPKGRNFDRKLDSKVTDETKCKDDGTKDTCINGKLENILDVAQHNRSKGQTMYVQTGQSYRNWTSNTSLHFIPPDGSEYGPWSPWTESSQCSRTCGGGVAHQDRICIDMRPDDRHSCVGRARRYISCNVQDCPPDSKDFRGVQCSRFNSLPYKGQYFSWLPYHQPNSPCELFCTPRGADFYQKVDTKVIDGTKCRDDGSKDICVDGQCLPVGCDGNLGSSTREDECGVCGGDGSTCTVVEGVFDEDSYEVGYNDILLIPVGATSILIQQVQRSGNFLAIRNSDGTFYLNGNWRIEFSREFRIAGTVFSYERRLRVNLAPDTLRPETLKAQGPTTEAIFIVLLYQQKNLGIRYKYSVPTAMRTPSPDSYIWATGDFEPCSKSCGGGVQHRSVCCIRESDCDILDERLCDPLSKPDVNATCNNEPCPSSWKIGEWTTCSSECGRGTQFRIVYCYQQKAGNIVLVPDELCEQPKPLFMQFCNVVKECSDWFTGEWSECSVLCGGGERTRKIVCFYKDEEVERSQCDPNEKPFDKENCNMMPCDDDDDDICRLPHDTGLCNEFQWRWYFDYESTNCLRFIYSGCDGNANNFASYPECEKRCGHDMASEFSTDLEFKTEYCFQHQDPGPCSNSEINWFYDSTDGVCKEFYYGGCKGNGNRFETRKECETSCFKAQDMCSLPLVKGPCSGAFVQWYYDPNQDDCLEFTFGGCQGNANRFSRKEPCQQACVKISVTTEQSNISSDICSQPKKPGPCLGYYRQWYYNSSDHACQSFVYGGCEGNDNRFENRRDCEQQCVTNTSKAVCRLPMAPGTCDNEYPRWFYNAQTQSCLLFMYGGCEGNKNRFKTAEICQRFCTGVKRKSGREDVTYVTPSTTTTTALSTTQCPPSNCGEIKCPYGIEESFDNHGCSSCRCSNPCEVQICPEGSRCAIDVTRTAQEGIITKPVCRRVHKPGVCSSSAYSAGPRDCETRCRDDADCRGEYKCCNNGCAFTCLPPSDEPFVPATQPEPATILPGVNVTQGHIGQPAELPCNAMGWPKPTVTWRRDTTMLPLLSQRYEQLPNYALLIRSVVYEDGGDYSCHAHNGIGSGAVYKVTLIIDFQPELPSAPRGEENDFNSRDSEPDVEPLPSPWDNAKPTDSDCVDDPRFSKCNVIVNANYCNNKFYGKFCCASCMKAGQLQDIPVV